MRYADSKCKIVSEGDSYVVTGKDVFSKRDVCVRIPSEQLYSYRQGNPIDTAMYSLNDSEREFLISGIYDSWDDLFDDSEID